MSKVARKSSNQHAIFLYENNSTRDLASAQCINQGLEQGQLCIFASVNAYDTSQLERVSSLIHG